MSKFNVVMLFILFFVVDLSFAQDFRLFDESEPKIIKLTIYPDSTGFEYITRYEKWYMEYTDVIIKKYVYKIINGKLIFIKIKQAYVNRKHIVPESYEFKEE